MVRRPNKSETADKGRAYPALERLREVAQQRGQELMDYVPAERRTVEEGATTEEAVKEPASVRGVLPPWARRWAPHSPVPNATRGQNLAQRIVLIISFLVILGMALFPPWIYVFNPSAELRDRYVRLERPAGYHFIFSDHSPRDESQLLTIFNFRPTTGWERAAISLHLFSVRLDTSRLQVQIVVALLLTTILFFALRGTQEPAPTNGQ